jgi:hypothetical protein
MAKIIIYEDEELDIIDRYARLNEHHEVHVRLIGSNFSSYVIDNLYDYYFERERIIRGIPKEEEEADVYFMDGLRGKCFEIIDGLPKERCFIVTGSVWVTEKAEERGYNLASEDLATIIDNIVGSN